MKKLLATFCAGMALCFLGSCAEPQGEVKSYNQGINIIPTPQSLVQHDGFFRLGSNTAIEAASPEAKTVAEFFAAKMRTATGLNIQVAEKGNIQLSVDPSLDVANDEGYTLDVTKDGAVVVAKTAHCSMVCNRSYNCCRPKSKVRRK